MLGEKGRDEIKKKKKPIYKLVISLVSSQD